MIYDVDRAYEMACGIHSGKAAFEIFCDYIQEATPPLRYLDWFEQNMIDQFADLMCVVCGSDGNHTAGKQLAAAAGITVSAESYCDFAKSIGIPRILVYNYNYNENWLIPPSQFACKYILSWVIDDIDRVMEKPYALCDDDATHHEMVSVWEDDVKWKADNGLQDIVLANHLKSIEYPRNANGLVIKIGHDGTLLRYPMV